jgi:hypothetical protein
MTKKPKKAKAARNDDDDDDDAKTAIGKREREVAFFVVRLSSYDEKLGQ